MFSWHTLTWFFTVNHQADSHPFLSQGPAFMDSSWAEWWSVGNGPFLEPQAVAERCLKWLTDGGHVLVKWMLGGPRDSSALLPPLEVNTQKTWAQPEISQWMVKAPENLITPGNITLLRSLGTATSHPFQKSKKNRGCGTVAPPSSRNGLTLERAFSPRHRRMIIRVPECWECRSQDPKTTTTLDISRAVWESVANRHI